jgi:putative acyl-CoA dehydrogenase
MAMTEKQGGSDVRANTTRAVPAGGDGYLLTGHKWFCSAPMCDLFLVLAQAPEGLTCFLLPRVLPDGTRNAMRIHRLKDKLGNRSNASSEVEYDGAFAWRVGEPGRGVATIIEMVSATRLDCVLGSAAAIRQACVAATHHAGTRRSFGTRLVSHPLMASVLADLALESEAATTLAMRLAAAADRAALGDAGEAALLRLALPAAKYWVCKRTPMVTAEALECLGGNGYVEESGLPRLYRDAPLNSLWEGSGNVTALDVLRALTRSPGSADALLAEIDLAAGADRRLDAAGARLRDELKEATAPAETAPATTGTQYRARRLAGQVAVTMQAALLVRHAPGAVADAFCASRLEPGVSGGVGPGAPFGTLPDGLDLGPVLARSSAATDCG